MGPNLCAFRWAKVTEMGEERDSSNLVTSMFLSRLFGTQMKNILGVTNQRLPTGAFPTGTMNT